MVAYVFKKERGSEDLRKYESCLLSALKTQHQFSPGRGALINPGWMCSDAVSWEMSFQYAHKHIAVEQMSPHLIFKPLKLSCFNIIMYHE